MKHIIFTIFLVFFLTWCSLINNDNSNDENIIEWSGSIVEVEILSISDINNTKDQEDQKQLEEYNKTLIIKYESYLQDTKLDILQIKKGELSISEYNEFVKELDLLNAQSLEDYKVEIFSKYQ